MKRSDVIKDLKRIKLSRAFGKDTAETNAWLHGIFDLLYCIAEGLGVFDDEDDDDED